MSIVTFLADLAAGGCYTVKTAMTDSDLLHAYVNKGDAQAFAELTRRHLNLVYSAARRHVNGDDHLAEDVTQLVFIDLARKAPRLLEHASLAGWLYACARFNAINTIRSQQRRLGREQASLMVAEPTASPDWDRIRPVLDEALDELDERDREFVLLRFFGQQSFAAIGRQFAVSENAAQKAVARALDVLSMALSRRGVTSTGSAIALALAQTGVSAPAALLPSVTAAVAGAVPVLSVGTAASISGSVLSAVKLAAALTLVAGAAAAAGYWSGAHRQLVVSANDARAQDVAANAERRRLEQQVRAEATRAATAEADTATLLRAIADAKDERLRALASQRTVQIAATTPPQGGTVYAIQPGDTFPKIARAYQITLQDLKAANPNVNAARLRVGQQITLPAGAGLPTPASR